MTGAPSRREFVAMLLGALGCGKPARPIDGELVDTGQRAGHAIVRDGPALAVTTWREHQVVIVGSGVAGLAAAWELRRNRITDVAVLELGDTLGGTARGGVSAVTPYPWG